MRVDFMISAYIYTDIKGIFNYFTVDDKMTNIFVTFKMCEMSIHVSFESGFFIFYFIRNAFISFSLFQTTV